MGLLLVVLSTGCAGIERPKPPLLAHRIVERQDISVGAYTFRSGLTTPGARRMAYRVVVNVDDLPSEAALKELAEHLWTSGNKGWDKFIVGIYLPGMDVESVHYAKGEYTPHGLKTFCITEGALLDAILLETKWGDPVLRETIRQIERDTNEVEGGEK